MTAGLLIGLTAIHGSLGISTKLAAGVAELKLRLYDEQLPNVAVTTILSQPLRGGPLGFDVAVSLDIWKF